jgi:hypothetical protein
VRWYPNHSSRQQIQVSLATARHARPEMNAREIKHRLDRYLVDWRGLLCANVAQGQQALQRLVAGRLTFTPQEDFYAFQGTGTIQPIIAGVVQKLASPPGFVPIRVERERDAMCLKLGEGR